MSDRIEVCPADDLGEGERRIVETDAGAEIGVFNVGGTYHALLNSCRHKHGPLCEGQVRPHIETKLPEPGERVTERWSEDEHVIECPWHGWSYFIESGEHTGDADTAVPTFDVTVEDGVLYVEG